MPLFPREPDDGDRLFADILQDAVRTGNSAMYFDANNWYGAVLFFLSAFIDKYRRVSVS